MDQIRRSLIAYFFAVVPMGQSLELHSPDFAEHAETQEFPLNDDRGSDPEIVVFDKRLKVATFEPGHECRFIRRPRGPRPGLLSHPLYMIGLGGIRAHTQDQKGAQYEPWSLVVAGRRGGSARLRRRPRRRRPSGPWLDGAGDSCDSASACSGGSHDVSCSLR